MTSDEVGKAASLLGTGSWRREQLLMSLLRQRSWTPKQRELVDKMVRDEAARHKRQSGRQ